MASGDAVRDGSAPVAVTLTLRSSGGGLGDRFFPPDFRLNLIRLTDDTDDDANDSSSRKRLRPAGEILNFTISDFPGILVAPGPSRPTIAVGVAGSALTGVAANGLPALEPVVAGGFGED